MIIRFDCPLCDWSMIDAQEETLGDVAGPLALDRILDVPDGTIAKRALTVHRQQVEDTLQQHLGTHSLIEWVTKVQQLLNRVRDLEAEIDRLRGPTVHLPRDGAL